MVQDITGIDVLYDKLIDAIKANEDSEIVISAKSMTNPKLQGEAYYAELAVRVLLIKQAEVIIQRSEAAFASCEYKHARC